MKGKTLFLGLTVAGVIAQPCASGTEAVSWSNIGRETAIIGKLGVPLGKRVEIEATIIAGESLDAGPSIAFLGKFFLRVEKVNGELLRPNVPFKFWATDALNLPADEDSLRKRIEKQSMREADYVGSKYRLLVCEGAYVGDCPPELPDGFFTQSIPEPGIPVGQPVRFRSFLTVSRVLETTSQKRPNKSVQPTTGTGTRRAN